MNICDSRSSVFGLGVGRGHLEATRTMGLAVALKKDHLIQQQVIDFRGICELSVASGRQ